MTLIALSILVFIYYPAPLSSLTANFRVGGFYGLRQVADAEIKKVYGQGGVFFLFAELELKGFFFGGGYEGGYSRRGVIGLFHEPATLEIAGCEMYAGFQLRLKNIAPYLRGGLGSYAYKQTIQSAYLTAFKVDHKKQAPVAAAGLRVFPGRHFFIAGEIKYVPLKVKPFDEEVDLSGFRWLAGVGLAF